MGQALVWWIKHSPCLPGAYNLMQKEKKFLQTTTKPKHFQWDSFLKIELWESEVLKVMAFFCACRMG